MRSKDLSAQVLGLREDIARLNIERSALEDIAAYEDEIHRLKTRVSDLQIEEAQIRDQYSRERREMEHMIGLERKRQEQELAAERREVAVQIREENLAADKGRFEETLAFHEKQMEEQVKYLKSMFAQVLDRLPNVNVKVKADGAVGE